MSRVIQLKQFLEESPGDNFLTHALALEYVKAGEDEKALECFAQNLAGNPLYIPTYFHYGKLLERIGKPEEAIAIYEKGMEVSKASGDQHSFSELRSVFEELTF